MNPSSQADTPTSTQIYGREAHLGTAGKYATSASGIDPMRPALGCVGVMRVARWPE